MFDKTARSKLQDQVIYDTGVAGNNVAMLGRECKKDVVINDQRVTTDLVRLFKKDTMTMLVGLLRDIVGSGWISR